VVRLTPRGHERAGAGVAAVGDPLGAAGGRRREADEGEEPAAAANSQHSGGRADEPTAGIEGLGTMRGLPATSLSTLRFATLRWVARHAVGRRGGEP